MKVILYNQDHPGVTERESLFDIWRSGIEANGDKWENVRMGDHSQFGDVAIGWGIRVINAAHGRALRYVCNELGFLGNRFDNLSVSIGALNGAGALPGQVIAGRGERWNHLRSHKRKNPERHNRVLILGQVCSDTSLGPLGFRDDERTGAYKAWVLRMVDFLEGQGREVGFRPHPHDPMWSGPGGVQQFDSKEAAFAWADLAVAFSSNALVEAYLAGLDVLPCHHTSLAWDVRSRLDHSRYVACLDEDAWMDKVASYQWSRHEIVTGVAWRYIRENL